MRSLDRRDFIRTGVGAGVAAAAGIRTGGHELHAQPKPSTSPEAATISPGFYGFDLGDYQITVLSDGGFGLPAELFGTNVTAQERADYYASRKLPPNELRLPSNPLVIDTGSRRVLVDSESGDAADPASSTGRLLLSMAAAGIAPGSIDLVVLTHAHGDHIGGLVDPTAGTPRFPGAEVVVSSTEHSLWTASDVRQRVPAWVDEWGIVDGTRAAFTALGNRVRTVPMDGEITSGIHGLASAGHTPGHMSIVVASGDEQLIVVGDAIVNHHTHFEHPDWTLGVDHDPDAGVRTRRRLLDRLASDRGLVHGFHLPFPGVGHVVRDGGAFRWLPMV